MRDERYVGNARGMFTPDNQTLLIGEHVVSYSEGSDPDADFEHGTTPCVGVEVGGVAVVIYRDFETGMVVVDVTGDPDRVLWNEATFNHDTNYVDENTTRIKYI
jgi:hypothetical protein